MNRVGDLVQVRSYQDSDLEVLVEVGKEERIFEFFKLRGWSESKQLMAWEESNKLFNNFRHFKIIDKNSNNIIGYTGIWRIDWNEKHGLVGSSFMNPEYWGKGFNQETKKFIIEYAFEELGLEKLKLGCDINNKRSYNSALKSGFKFVEVKTNYLKTIDGESYADFAFFEITKLNYISKTSNL